MGINDDLLKAALKGLYAGVTAGVAYLTKDVICTHGPTVAKGAKDAVTSTVAYGWSTSAPGVMHHLYRKDNLTLMNFLIVHRKRGRFWEAGHSTQDVE